jgi:cellulose synthase/poly-beta-1,6-N-acetylglucosamine synthase-like glycosyltransferase
MTTLGTVGWLLASVPVVLAIYAWAGYPLLLALFAPLRGRRLVTTDPAEWPAISISLPVYNEAHLIANTLEALLALDYPADKRQVLVISDASSDGTDDIVRGFAGRGVELLRMPKRGGKIVGENAGAALLRGELVVNTDAATRMRPDALKKLVRVFQDPEVGTASGCDAAVGVTREGSDAEASYTSYEMGLRGMETRLGSIVGSSGCFYAIRVALHRVPLAGHLSRDFASALRARDAGLRAVSVRDARCVVPTAATMQIEFKRKIRTMSRGLVTLWHWRRLLNPFRHGLFAWTLASHKLGRWLLFLTAPIGLVGLALAATTSPVAALLLVFALAGVLLGAAALRWKGAGRPPRFVTFCGSVLVAFLAGWLAWMQALRGVENAMWEPTKRG